MQKISIFTEHGEQISSEEKVVALKEGFIRGIARILVFNNNGQVFLQKRGKNKEIAPDTWDNSVGGHVDEGESFLTAARREASEELGIPDIELEEISKYYFEEPTKYGLGKSFDTLYIGEFNGELKLEKEEIQDGKWIDLDVLRVRIEKFPEEFAPGVKRAIKEYFLYLDKL